jgi:putative transposase
VASSGRRVIEKLKDVPLIVLGRRSLPEQNTDYILIRFGKKVGAARQNYGTFVQSGITQGKRDDLVGGGLKRSYQSLPGKELVASDQRILGSGAFVEACRHEDKSDVMPMETIVENLAAALDVTPYELKQRTKKKKISEVRNIISYVVVRCGGYNGAEMARYLNVTRSAVSTGADRGRSLIEGNKNLEAAVSNFTK